VNTLFNNSDHTAIQERLNRLKPNTPRQWGKMNAAQMLAHCNASLETAMGHNVIKPVGFIGRFIGSLLRPRTLGPKPFGKNSPTDNSYKFPDNVTFEEQKAKIIRSIQQFHEGGPSRATRHPHPFFGKFTPNEWGVFQWKHIDHHLRQFGV
jgi:hypothetical protein